jgi:hypothetical protein
MISGDPPFHGENHIDLLRNIQRKAVRLPKDVRVSKECVNLLRVLLSRNPLTRAGFKEFFEACDAFVSLGCQGLATVDEGTCKRPSVDLGTIPEYQTEAVSNVTPTSTNSTQPLSDSVMTATTNSTIPQTQPSQQDQTMAKPNPNSVSSTTMPITKPRTTNIFNPLGIYTSPAAGIAGSPAMTELPTIHSKRLPQPIEMPSRQKDVVPVLQSSVDENSFVMVEHGSSLHKSTTPVTVATDPVPSTTTNTAMVSHYHESNRQRSGRHSLEHSPPTSAGFFLSRMPSFIPNRADSTIIRSAKGMLSTSPGTGGALMNMLTGRPNLLTRGGSGVPVQSPISLIDTEKQLEQQFKAAAKMLATAEDIGRRAISVAHLGDKRAYHAMRVLMMSESNSSSILSIIPMEGIDEESSGDHDSGTVTDDDDSSSTEPMASTRRRISTTSNADKSMPDVKIDDDNDEEEMPFAVHSEPIVSPLLSAGMPSRGGSSFNNHINIKDSSYTMNTRSPTKPSAAVIRSHFNEALTCYLKALKMVKGALTVIEGVAKEITSLEGKRLTSDQQGYTNQLKNQCDVTSNWLSNQFQGVLERGNATNIEITKLCRLSANATGVDESSMSSTQQNVVVMSVEELLYTHALGYGREGAVKQLLGHFEAARACYRSAGLLAETLLMEPHVEGEDRKTIESYVDSFAAQITELDTLLLSQQQQQQQQQQSRLLVCNSASASNTGSMTNSGRRVGQMNIGGNNSQISMFPGK